MATNQTTQNFSALFNMFDKAAETLRFPKIQLEHGDCTIRLVRCGPNSRYAGNINIEINGNWFGRIERDGNMYTHMRQQLTTENVHPDELPIFDYLLAFSANPAFHARMHGQQYNYCCFCARELTDAVSVKLGYGPICADKYGLPHSLEHIHTNVDNASLDVVLNGNLSELL